MSQSLKKLTDQELADLVRQNLKDLSVKNFRLLKENVKQSKRYSRECRRRGSDMLTFLKNNPAS